MSWSIYETQRTNKGIWRGFSQFEIGQTHLNKKVLYFIFIPCSRKSEDAWIASWAKLKLHKFIVTKLEQNITVDFTIWEVKFVGFFFVKIMFPIQLMCFTALVVISSWFSLFWLKCSRMSICSSSVQADARTSCLPSMSTFQRQINLKIHFHWNQRWSLTERYF